MSFQLYGDNRKESIEADVPYEEGDYLITDPGVQECDSRLFFLRTNQVGLVTGGPLENVFELDKVPDFGSERRAYPFRAGVNYYVEDLEDVAWNDSITITHLADPTGKRYVEVWITYYPTAGFSPILHEGTNVVTATDMFMKIPRLYPDLVQSITLPSGCSATAFLDNTYYRIRMDGNDIIIWGDDRALIYEWNEGNTEYDLAFDFNDADCSVVYSAAIKDDKCVISYYDTNTTSERLAYIEKTTSWALEGKYSNPDSNYNSPVLLHHVGDTWYILIGGNKDYAVCYLYSNRSVFFEAIDGTNPTTWLLLDFTAIPYDNSGAFTYAFGNGYWSIGGGQSFESISRTKFAHNRSEATWVQGLEDESGDSRMYFGLGPFLMWQGGTSFPKVDFVLYNLKGYELWNYPHLNFEDYEQPRGFKFGLPVDTWLVDKYAANFTHIGSTPSTFWVYKESEVIRLEDWVEANNKVYEGTFHPVASPYFLTNHQDGTLKLLEISEHYTELNGTCVLKIDTTKAITTTTDFDFPTEPTNTTTKFRLSFDNITFYKWDGVSSWVTEATPANGNTLADFIAGCQDGFTVPADTYTAYVGLYITCSADDAEYKIDYADVKLYLTTISVTSNSFLADDSKMLIEHLSDTETKITSKVQQDVFLSIQLCLIAPPYNVEYED